MKRGSGWGSGLSDEKNVVWGGGVSGQSEEQNGRVCSRMR